MKDETEGAMLDELRAVADAAAAGPGDRFAGRGIVVCAGGGRMIVNAYVLVRLLREVLGTRLPIEVWHLGAEEMPRFLAETLRTHGAEIVDARTASADAAADIHDGWQLKAFALANCRFAEVLLLDADQVPATDPAAAFAWPEYRQAGAVLWPDVLHLAAENPVWRLCGLAPRETVSAESGQLLVDKRRHWPALSVALFMNERADVFYETLYGDKDTFLIAWLFCDAPFAMVPHRPFMNGRFLGQRDFSGALLFQHRTNCKWTLNGDNHRPDGFRHQEVCESFLADLRAIWDGRIFHAPPRSAEARAQEAALEAAGRFVLVRGEGPPEALDLLGGHQIGRGRSWRLANWHVADGEGGLQLVLRDAARPVARLTPADGGYWIGRELMATGADLVVAPASDAADDRTTAARGLVAQLVRAAEKEGPLDAAGKAKLQGALELLVAADPQAAAEIDAWLAAEVPCHVRTRTMVAELRQMLQSAPEGGAKRARIYLLSNVRHYKPG